ncbi:helix-turn-helix domain-containing protein [Nocardioides sp.]|uniref:helix-turn-helix domain-containing protein n=1 Tax=Nocardioides sp. TaxID=35761 RepID=UPI0035B432E0
MRKIVLREGALYGVTKRLDISRDELARRMKVATSTAYRVDAGKVEPSPAFIAGLMDVSGQPFEELFDIVGSTEAVNA